MEAEIMIRQFFKISASVKPRFERMEKMAEPTIMQTMKQEKTIPRGVEPVSRTGVHRNTKMYMQDSRRDCTAPSSITCSSAKMILNPSRQDPPKLAFLFP